MFNERVNITIFRMVSKNLFLPYSLNNFDMHNIKDVIDFFEKFIEPIIDSETLEIKDVTEFLDNNIKPTLKI